MIKISYPQKKPLIKTSEGKDLVYCLVRKRWMQLTPEEWVRQNFLLYLIEVLSYPGSLIGVERQFEFLDMKKRFDIVVHDRKGAPFMIIECKEMNQRLSDAVLSQVLRYNVQLRARYIVVTNGSYCAAFEQIGTAINAIDELPLFTQPL